MNGKILLLVEDNPDDVDLTLRAFKKCKIANEIVVARDGAEAIEYLTSTGVYEGNGPEDVPQLVLLDLHLPKISGLEVLRVIRSYPKTKLMPVVVLTSSAEEPDIIASYELGANSYIRKPVDFNQFLEAAQQLGLYWLMLNQAVPNSYPTPSQE
jgi:two-component system, response regulator